MVVPGPDSGQFEASCRACGVTLGLFNRRCEHANLCLGCESDLQLATAEQRPIAAMLVGAPEGTGQ